MEPSSRENRLHRQRTRSRSPSKPLPSPERVYNPHLNVERYDSTGDIDQRGVDTILNPSSSYHQEYAADPNLYHYNSNQHDYPEWGNYDYNQADFLSNQANVYNNQANFYNNQANFYSNQNPLHGHTGASSSAAVGQLWEPPQTFNEFPDYEFDAPTHSAPNPDNVEDPFDPIEWTGDDMRLPWNAEHEDLEVPWDVPGEAEIAGNKVGTSSELKNKNTPGNEKNTFFFTLEPYERLEVYSAFRALYPSVPFADIKREAKTRLTMKMFNKLQTDEASKIHAYMPDYFPPPVRAMIKEDYREDEEDDDDDDTSYDGVNDTDLVWEGADEKERRAILDVLVYGPYLHPRRIRKTVNAYAKETMTAKMMKMMQSGEPKKIRQVVRRLLKVRDLRRRKFAMPWAVDMTDEKAERVLDKVREILHITRHHALKVVRGGTYTQNKQLTPAQAKEILKGTIERAKEIVFEIAPYSGRKYDVSYFGSEGDK